MVELSQQYIADVLGENWQEEYYVWDCAAGTGNLLNGLTNKYNIWASTLDPQDVQVMKDRIANGANLLESHVFQFDFLNDEFDKLPAGLQEIINDPQKRRKLVVYINPPYAEAGNVRTMSNTGQNKTDVAVQNRVYSRYFMKMGIAGRELYAQFMARIYVEFPDCLLGLFSKLKVFIAPNFQQFRQNFPAEFLRGFIAPSQTFDNVKGKFPIGFLLWRQYPAQTPDFYDLAVFDTEGTFLQMKRYCHERDFQSINDWIITTRQRPHEFPIGFMVAKAADFQNNNYNFIVNSKKQLPSPRGTIVTDQNLLQIGIYYAVRHCIAATWLNDRDLFHAPRDGWQTDTEFQNNSLTFTLFSNNIQSQYGTNHWIPFTEAEVDAKERFESHFMTDFMAGKLVPQEDTSTGSLFQSQSFVPSEPLVFSPEATAVFDAGRDLWRYYHAQPNANPNASYYDIRAHFQGRNDKGKMNAKSDDPEYMRLWGELKEAMEVLRQRIVPKVYEYGFLIA